LEEKIVGAVMKALWSQIFQRSLASYINKPSKISIFFVVTYVHSCSNLKWGQLYWPPDDDDDHG
jgi:hypothetical protein